MKSWGRWLGVFQVPRKIQTQKQQDLSNEKRALAWLGYIGDEKLPSYIGIIINHYKDPY